MNRNSLVFFLVSIMFFVSSVRAMEPEGSIQKKALTPLSHDWNVVELEERHKVPLRSLGIFFRGDEVLVRAKLAPHFPPDVAGVIMLYTDPPVSVLGYPLFKNRVQYKFWFDPREEVSQEEWGYLVGEMSRKNVLYANFSGVCPGVFLAPRNIKGVWEAASDPSYIERDSSNLYSNMLTFKSKPSGSIWQTVFLTRLISNTGRIFEDAEEALEEVRP